MWSLVRKGFSFLGRDGCSDRSLNGGFARLKTESGFRSTHDGQVIFMCQCTRCSELIHHIIRLGYAAASLPWGQVSDLLVTVASTNYSHRITMLQVGFEIVNWLVHLDKWPFTTITDPLPSSEVADVRRAFSLCA